MLVDTHTHLYLDDFSPNPTTAVERAVQAGVGRVILPNIDSNSVDPMRRLHQSCPQVTAMAIGLHPTEVTDNDIDGQLKFVFEELSNHPSDYIAVGEIGIDLYWDKQYRDAQMAVFERQLQLASDRDLPVIIHCREGLDETLEVIQGLGRCPQLVFHSFGGTVDDVNRIRRLGDFYFGINGIVTFKNSKLRDVLPEITLDRIVLETDSPYLTPVPYRGKRNESAYMVHTAAHVALSLRLSVEQVADATTHNAFTLFKL